ncbi:MAG: aspartate/glutamate racemase family protein [Synergistaceae bacterium]|nr:aspartate/glutamate racemase family protein [Synergistaceae bacterium]
MDKIDPCKIGILCWEEGHVPKGLVQLETLPGNSTNTDSYPFSVRLSRIKGANIHTVLENPSQDVLENMIIESRKMISEGIEAITTSCGFNAIFQEKLASSLEVPVFTSSLLQVPLVHKMLGPDRSIAVITAKKSALKIEHLRAAGITVDIKLNILGMENSPEWNKIFTAPDDDVDLNIIAGEVISTAKEAVSQDKSIGAFVLECTDLPPFSEAIREELHLPVFDFLTLIEFVARSIGVMKPSYIQ